MRLKKEQLLELVFPENIYCICCGSIIDGKRAYSLCDDCMGKLHWNTGRTCTKCGKALHETFAGRRCYDCMAEYRYFDRGFSCVEYGLNERAILMDMKYGDKPYICRKLADAMYDRISVEELNYDLVIPVPIHRERRNQRGYNQAELIGKRLAKKAGIGYNERVLVRKQNTDALKGLSPQQRRAALQDAFSVAEAYLKEVNNRNILLIDDIYTTGSTADSCSRVLKEAGAGKVYVLTFASAPNRNMYKED